jgi:hypothetical protein
MRARVSTDTLKELEVAFKQYANVVCASSLSLSSQADYIDRVQGFVRWLRYDFEPGLRVNPYQKKDKPSPDSPTM